MIPFRKGPARDQYQDRGALAPLNRQLEEAQTLPDTAFTDWLWRTDPEEPLFAGVLLNRNHLLGLPILEANHNEPKTKNLKFHFFLIHYFPQYLY